MAKSFDFELTANDEASAAILRIEEIVKHLNPLLDRTRDALALGGQESRDNPTTWAAVLMCWLKMQEAVFNSSAIWSRRLKWSVD